MDIILFYLNKSYFTPDYASANKKEKLKDFYPSAFCKMLACSLVSLSFICSDVINVSSVRAFAFIFFCHSSIESDVRCHQPHLSHSYDLTGFLCLDFCDLILLSSLFAALFEGNISFLQKDKINSISGSFLFNLSLIFSLFFSK